MTTSGIVEPIYIFEQFLFGIIACLEGNFPNHFRFQGFEEGLDSGVIITVPLARHRLFEFLLCQQFTELG